MNHNGPLQVLVVEDSKLAMEQLCELIRSVSYPVSISTVATQQEAMAALNKFVPDVLILDLKLREGTGFSVLKELGESEPRPVTIILTNYALPKYRELSALMGADYFLDKAQDFGLLPSIIKSIIVKH